MSQPIVYDHRGRVAVVTGGTRGIGFGIAECLLAGGAKVVLAGRDEPTGAKALADLGGGDRLHFLRADVTSREECDALIDHTVDRFGTIDILINNAGGVRRFLPVTQMSDEDWDHTMDLNLNSLFWCSRRAVPHMVQNGWGRVVSISSLEGLAPLPAFAHYSTAKRGTHAFIRSLCKEVSPSGVTANVIAPGVVDTDMAKAQVKEAAAANGMTEEAFYDMMKQQAPIRRLVTVHEVAAVAGLICSEVGGALTGQVFALDGGISEH